MSTIVGRDDLRAKLYSAGVKIPRDLNEVMRLIDVYSIQVARKAQQQDSEDIPEVTAPSFTPLKPGEWSVALQVICCTGCTRVRRWDDFHVDKHHPIGRKTLCRDCRSKAEEKTLPVRASDVRRGGWVCPGCAVRKAPLEFPLEKRENPRKSVMCLSCIDNPPA